MNIEEIKEMVLKYRKELKANNIPVGVIDDVKIARRNAQYFAITQMNIKCHYDIYISGKAIMAGEESLKNTLLHELCHTIRGCMNHGEKFKRYAERVSNIYNVNITTRATKEEIEKTENYNGDMRDKLFS